MANHRERERQDLPPHTGTPPVDWDAVSEELSALQQTNALSGTLDSEQMEPDVTSLDALAEEDLPELGPRNDAANAYDESIQRYLDSISGFPLLSTAEEVSYGEARIAGDIAAKRLQEDDYLPEEKASLEAQIAYAARARKRLTQSNLKLVVSVAKKFYGAPLPMQDMIQEGNMGLMRAVDRYNPHLKKITASGEEVAVTYRFSTYATWWIRQGIQRAIHDTSRVVRLPVHLHEALLAVHRATQRLHDSLQRSPSVPELSEALGVSEDKLRSLLLVAPHALSLEAPKGEDSDDALTLGETIPDSSLPEASAVVESRNLARDLERALAQLTPRERRILALRYGLVDGQSHTLEEVGQMLNGMTRERVRQIEADALRQLRNGETGELLIGYFENAEDIEIETTDHISETQFAILDMLSEGMSIAAIADQFKGKLKRPDVIDLIENKTYGLAAKLGAETVAGMVVKAAVGNVIPVPRATPEAMQRFSGLDRLEVSLLRKELELAKPSDPQVIFPGNGTERKQAQKEALQLILHKLGVGTFEQAAMVYASILRITKVL